ncbi:hypothetical protein PM082_018248 [Marasmius tenuissimus]|nr:hypothetical protein PM082_018248 [Marasmius tenuissimus]
MNAARVSYLSQLSGLNGGFNRNELAFVDQIGFALSREYQAVDEFFRRGGHNPQTYARDRGYPVLQKWKGSRSSVVEENVGSTRYAIPTQDVGKSNEEPPVWQLPVGTSLTLLIRSTRLYLTWSWGAEDRPA